jgi:oxalate---CoA ligase
LDASAFEDVISYEDDWQQWPILSTDGDVAALIQLVSEDKVRRQLVIVATHSRNSWIRQVEFRINTSQAQAARPGLDWNSKKAGLSRLRGPSLYTD